MNYQIIHRTVYRYSDNVSLCHNEACLLPRATATQHCSASRLDIQPSPAQFMERSDFFGNRLHYFAIQTPHRALTVTSHCTVTTQPPMPLPASPPWPEARRQLEEDDSGDGLDARGFTLESPFINANPAIADYARASFPTERPLLAAVQDLVARIHRDFTYDPHFTTIATPLADVFAHRRGVCQDFAHLAIACVRSLGLAARYVSGYLETLPPPGEPKLQGADASHAWLAVYMPGVGWWDFDPTNNLTAGEQYITVAWGRDYGDVTPLKGIIFGGGGHELDVAVDVTRRQDDAPS